MEKQPSQWLIPVLLAAGAAGALWYYWNAANQPVSEPVAAPTPVAEEREAILEPLHPMPQQAPGRADRPELKSLPPLDRSDDYFKMEITDIFGDPIEDMLVASGMIERIVATVDNLPRTHVAERIRPLGRLGGQFVVDEQDDSGEFTINSSNYDRYDALVDLMAGADLGEVVEVYRRFYPLFQSAYVDLGYPGGYFNERLVEVIDHLPAAPGIHDSWSRMPPPGFDDVADPGVEGVFWGKNLPCLMRL